MDILTRKHFTAWLITALVAMNLLTMGALWYAVLRKPQAAPPPRNDNPREDKSPADVNRFLELELNLTPEQAARFEELRRRHAAEIQSVQEEIHRLKKAEMDELLKPQPDRSRGDALAAEIGTREAEKERLLFTHLSGLMAFCRPDQQERFRSIMNELIRMMGPPGQPQPDKKPPEKKSDGRPEDKPPREKPPNPNDERPPQKRR